MQRITRGGSSVTSIARLPLRLLVLSIAGDALAAIMLIAAVATVHHQKIIVVSLTRTESPSRALTNVDIHICMTAPHETGSWVATADKSIACVIEIDTIFLRKKANQLKEELVYDCYSIL
ncbi:hypothetical protein [Candidatus Vallotia cooleyia]|uniref:hypothetical protein n=1 Tax=Candidatus Vallotiella adelgis TaxID=1177211 RepID=UPI001D0169E2|nr:hypothetical protein [Candidatus Vallotia cooleyia]